MPSARDLYHTISPYDVMHAIGTRPRTTWWIHNQLQCSSVELQRTLRFSRSQNYVRLDDAGKWVATDAGRSLYLRIRDVPAPPYRDLVYPMATRVAVFVLMYPDESMGVCARIIREPYRKVLQCVHRSPFFGDANKLTLTGERAARACKHDYKQRMRLG